MVFIPGATTAIVAELAGNRLVPFVGAGASYSRLKVDWDALRVEMCNALSIDPSTHRDPLKVADLFATQIGDEAVATLLAKRLVVDSHDDALSRTHLQLMAMNPGVIYTTNQDNIFEKMFEAKGRNYQIIVDLADLTAASPTARKLVKYHGDVKKPNSVIFTGKSYERRTADTEHFLNIRMKSDLLAKGFLFIGYSFNDPNVRLLFDEIRKIVPSGLPKSYLIAFRYDPVMEELKSDFGIEIIDPKRCFDTDLSVEEAFDQLIENISRQVFEIKSVAEAEDFFAPGEGQTAKVLIDSELKGALKLIAHGPFHDAVKALRVAIDQANIPDNLADTVVEALKALCDRVSSEKELAELPGILFNLHLLPEKALIPIAWMMKAVNRHGNSQGMPNTMLIYPPANRILAGAAALAIISLRDDGQPITDRFLNHLDWWLQEFSSLPENLQASVKEAVTWAYRGKVPSTLFAPPLLGTRTYDQILSDITEKLPKQFRKRLTD